MADTRRIQSVEQQATRYVGTLVGESTSREFRLAVAHEAIREQDIIAVDAQLRVPNATLTEDGQEPPAENIRVWAKVQRIERLNPLFPSEAGHELAATQTNPLDTVLSLSREMVTAVCQVLGSEPLRGSKGGKLDHLRYPPQPATNAYDPESKDVARVVLGELEQRRNRALDVAELSNRKDVDIKVDGHAIVTRHLAILAMTGAGKSWTARRIIEQLARKNYPIVIFDPHGDYTELAQVPALGSKVCRFYAQFPVFEEPAETVMSVVESLAHQLSNTQKEMFPDIFKAARAFLDVPEEVLEERQAWLSDYLSNENIDKYGIRPNLYFLADFTEALVRAGRSDDNATFSQVREWTSRPIQLSRQQAGWIDGLVGRLRRAAKVLRRMEEISKKTSRGAEPLPRDRKELVQYGQVSVISLAGYTGDFQATIYSIISDDIFEARVNEELGLPVLLLLEEAHNFAPGRATTSAEQRAIATTKQIAQEGRKFNVGLILISQRPSRLDETTLAMCNSYIIMRMLNPADQRFVRQVVETLGEDEARMLPDLDQGEAILSGELINFPVLVKIKQPESKGKRDERDAFEVLEEANRNHNSRVRR
jgi:uncharacterized protein